MGVQVVAHPRQALGLAQACYLVRQSTAVRRAVAWAVRHWPSGSTNSQRVQGPGHSGHAGGGVRICASNGLGGSSLQITGGRASYGWP